MKALINFLVGLSKADTALFEKEGRGLSFFNKRALDKPAYRTWEYRFYSARFEVYWGPSKGDPSGRRIRCLNEAARGLVAWFVRYAGDKVPTVAEVAAAVGTKD